MPITRVTDPDVAGGGSPVIENNGTEVSAGASIIEFDGDGVSVEATSPTAVKVTVSSSGTGGGGEPLVIEYNGTEVSSGASSIEFDGDGVEVTALSPTAVRVTITSSGTSSGSGVGENLLINGTFRQWQRNTSFTADGYTADRWRLTLGSGNTVTVSRQSVTLNDLSGQPQYMLRLARSATGAGNTVLEQRVEDVYNLANSNATVSFWAKATGSTSLAVSLTQNFGSGGSSNVDVAAQTASITTSWQRFTLTFAVPSIAGKTIGASNYLSVVLSLLSATGNATIDIAMAKLESGSTATDFEFPLLAAEVDACLRYYEVFGAASFGRWGSATAAQFGTSFLTLKRVIPNIAVVTQTWSGARVGITGVSGSSFAIAFTETVRTNAWSGGVNTNNVSAVAGEFFLLYTNNFSADAEL